MNGFYIDPGTKYQIDFRKGTIEVGSKNFKFDTSSVIFGQLDFYVLPSFFKDAFDLNFRVDFSSLSITLNTTLELPIARDYARNIRRNFQVTSPNARLLQAPLMFPRQRALLNGGILDYSLGAFRGQGLSSYDYGLTGGAEVLGGDAQGSILGVASQGGGGITSSSFSWTYVFDSTSYITSAALGNLYSDGLTQFGFRGGQISNEPTTIRTLFGKYSVVARTHPGWDAELYLNGTLVGYKKADSSGTAYFEIPLVYGTSFVQLRYYGPNGQFREEDRRIQIPFTFNPAGQVNYTVSAGKLNNTDENFFSANVVAGLTNWMTDKVGMDYVADTSFSQPLFYNSLSLRFSPEYMLSFDAAPLAYYSSTFNALYASQTAFDLTYTKYQNNLLYNPSNKTQEALADLYVPFTVGKTALNVRLTGELQDIVGGQRTYTYSGFLSSNIAQLNASFGYQSSVLSYGGGPPLRNYNITASLLYSLSFYQGPFDFLNGSLINVTARYGELKNSLDDIAFQVSKNIQQYVRVAVSADRNFVSRSTQLSLQIIADLPFTRSTTNVGFNNGSGTYSENVSGSIGFDSNYGSLQFNNLEWVGHSAASMRMFVDENGSGKYEKGDPIIKTGTITLRQAVASETSSNGIIRDWNLLPYTQYSADVDVNSIPNPLWIPKMTSFSFVTDPETYKRIDIPFFVGGVVDGKVLKVEDGSETPIQGLSLTIKSPTSGFNKTFSVFNDGSFYYMGVPPGEYEAYVDSSQLAILDVYSDPPVLKFTVKPTKNGDYVEGLRILLRNKKPASSAEVRLPVTRTAQPVPPKVVVPSPAKVSPSHSPAPGEAVPPRVKILPGELPVSTATENAETYSIQLGAFVKEANAVKFAKRASKETHHRFEVRFNNQSELYVVRSDTIFGGQKAAEEVWVLSNRRGFAGAFLLPLFDGPSRYLFWIELAQYKSISAASVFSRRLMKERKLPSVVIYSRTTRLFAVVAGPFKKRIECADALLKLRGDRYFAHARILVYGQIDTPSVFTALLDSFASHGAAAGYAKRFESNTGLISFVDFDLATGCFRIVSQACRTQSEANAILQKIKSHGGYPHARVIILR